MTVPYPQVKCPKCGWVHMAIPLQVAREHTTNAPEEMADYLTCYCCGAPAADFIPVEAADVPTSLPLYAVVIEGSAFTKLDRPQDAAMHSWLPAS